MLELLNLDKYSKTIGQKSTANGHWTSDDYTSWKPHPVITSSRYNIASQSWLNSFILWLDLIGYSGFFMPRWQCASIQHGETVDI